MIPIIFNPHAGRGRAERRLSTWMSSLSAEVELCPTREPEHAAELAQAAALAGCRVIAAAGGDGTVHEVANGLLAAGDHNLTLAVIPIGSANDFAYSLRRQYGTANLDNEAGQAIDVGQVIAAARQRYFVESLGLGLSARVTAESRKIHSLQGLLLYGLAAWRALAVHRPQSLNISWDGAPAEEQLTLMLSLMLGVREGNFSLAPEAVMDDGLFDAVHALDLGRWSALWMLPSLVSSGPPRNHPLVMLRRCQSVHVEAPHTEWLAIHTDGELFATADEALTAVQIVLHSRRLRAKVCPFPRKL